MLFNFLIELNDNDYLQFNKNHLKKSAVNKKIEKYTKTFLVVFTMCIAFFVMIKENLTETPLVAIIYLIICFSISLLWLLLFNPFRRFLENFQLKLQLKHDKPVSLKTAMQFYEDFIFSVDEQTEEKVKYSALTKLDKDENAIYLYVGNNKAHIIPLRYFANPEYINAFCAFINSKIQQTNVSE